MTLHVHHSFEISCLPSPSLCQLKAVEKKKKKPTLFLPTEVKIEPACKYREDKERLVTD